MDSTREFSTVPKVLRPNLVTAAQIYSTNMVRMSGPVGIRSQTRKIEPDRRAMEVCLQDLKLPSHPDAPEECLFQHNPPDKPQVAGFVVDFEKVVPVRNVFSYSRYAYDGGRGSGPDQSGGWRVHQVYELDGSVDGTSFVRLAVVDTRPPGFPNKPGSGGGLVGVKIEPKAGSTLGKYRYLRFLVSPSARNNFGGTFYAEVMAE